MVEVFVTVGDKKLRIVRVNTVVVGSGASGLNAIDRLWQYGHKDSVLVTEDMMSGTSRNTGSDKQTYYKLSLSGSDQDSIYDLANVFFSGHCVDGDVALCEASLSTQSFFKLVELGVPFPKNRYGEYVGYKTDHDPARRATSAGPFTSKMMTEKLEQAVRDKGVRVFDRLQVISILATEGILFGLLCLDRDAKDDDERYVAFNCSNVVYATGGPAGMYADSVYPTSQYGASGIAFEAGVRGANLTEWQIGLASLNPRWNVSGTYMQAIPRFISCDENGHDEREFLSDYFEDRATMLNNIFLKGYQWPFDVRKIQAGSSIIDILVYIEKYMKKRRIFLDYRTNPDALPIDLEDLSHDAKEYLEKTGTTQDVPYARLLHMNAPAVDLYRGKGVDLETERLEISLCVQHNNGGLAIDSWWHTNLRGFFAVGEVCGSHGVYRPGGSALNAGQTGATRAAQYIANKRKDPPRDNIEFLRETEDSISHIMNLPQLIAEGSGNIIEVFQKVTSRMSEVGGAIRSLTTLQETIKEVKDEIGCLSTSVLLNSVDELELFYRLRDTLLAQYVYLNAMTDYILQGGKSRGSALYTDPEGILPKTGLPGIFRFSPDDHRLHDRIQEIELRGGECHTSWRDVRKIPDGDDFFEIIWKAYRKHENIY